MRMTEEEIKQGDFSALVGSLFASAGKSDPTVFHCPS
jgi:hypothetical protein